MRISDWSSDVCSSDLATQFVVSLERSLRLRRRLLQIAQCLRRIARRADAGQIEFAEIQRRPRDALLNAVLEAGFDLGVRQQVGLTGDNAGGEYRRSGRAALGKARCSDRGSQ